MLAVEQRKEEREHYFSKHPVKKTQLYENMILFGREVESGQLLDCVHKGSFMKASKTRVS